MPANLLQSIKGPVDGRRHAREGAETCRQDLVRSSPSVALSDYRDRADQKVIGHYGGDQLGRGELITEHASSGAVHQPEPPSYGREVSGGEGEHHFAMHVMLYAVAMDPTAQVAIKRAVLKPARRG